MIWSSPYNKSFRGQSLYRIPDRSKKRRQRWFCQNSQQPSLEQYFVNYSVSTISKTDCDSPSEYSGNREDIMFDMELPQTPDSDPDLIEEVQIIGNNPKWNMLYFSLFLICLLSNGFLPSISTYTSMPYGSNAYHVSTILLTLANPIACFIAYFRPIKKSKYIYLTIGLSLVRVLLWVLSNKYSRALTTDFVFWLFIFKFPKSNFHISKIKFSHFQNQIFNFRKSNFQKFKISKIKISKFRFWLVTICSWHWALHAQF